MQEATLIDLNDPFDDIDNEREQNVLVLYSIFVSGVRDLYDQVFNAICCECEKERIIRCEVVKKMNCTSRFQVIQ